MAKVLNWLDARLEYDKTEAGDREISLVSENGWPYEKSWPILSSGPFCLDVRKTGIFVGGG